MQIFRKLILWRLYELTIRSSSIPGASIAFFGIGRSAVAGGGNNEPNGPSINYRLHGFSVGSDTIADLDVGQTNQTSRGQILSTSLLLDQGLTYCSLSGMQPASKPVPFHLIDNSTGSFDSIQTIDARATNGFNGSNSRLFFGGSGGFVFDDFAVDVAPFDTTPPTIAISADDSSLIAGESTTPVNFTLSEASTNFIGSDVSVSGGTLTGFSGSGQTRILQRLPQMPEAQLTG